MIAREKIEKIIKAGSLAPSGSNSQPWRFSVKGDAVAVYALYEKDHPILNYRNRGTLLAHGALLENMNIAAMALACNANITVFPRGGDNPVSEVVLVESEVDPQKQALYEAIFKRKINRKPYKHVQLDPTLRALFVGQEGTAEVQPIDDRKQVAILAKAASISERLMFENEKLHALLMEEIVWTEDEERNKKTGLFLPTMELNPAQRLILKALRSWKVTQFANKIGFSRMLAKGNADIYKKTSMMGVITALNDDKSFIDAGRIMERMWLQAIAAGLQFHIVTGVGFFWQRMFLGGDDSFTEKHKKITDDAYQIIKKVAGIPDDRIPAIIFRVGYGDEPSARSSKKEPEIIFE